MVLLLFCFVREGPLFFYFFLHLYSALKLSKLADLALGGSLTPFGAWGNSDYESWFLSVSSRKGYGVAHDRPRLESHLGLGHRLKFR